VADPVVPFASSYAPIGMAVGITASSLLLAVWTSSQLQRRIGWRAWRTLHYATSVVYALAVVHRLAIGEDVSTRWGAATVIASTTIVCGLTGMRALACPGRRRPGLLRRRPGALVAATEPVRRSPSRSR
jgi:predicted ferric reductase